MMTFDQALAEESRRLTIVIDRPAADCPPRAVCIGPTAVDMSVVFDQRAIDAEIRRREADLFKSWKSSDFSAHTFQQKRRSFKRAPAD